MIEFLNTINPIYIALSGGLLGFLAGFITRWLLFRMKIHTDLVHASISELESSLSKLFEEAVSYVEKLYSSEIDELCYTEIRRQLMVTRVSHTRKIINNLLRLNKKKYALPEAAYIDFRQATDRLFDKPKEGSSLGALSASISTLSNYYVKS